jgi:hypothetical protein
MQIFNNAELAFLALLSHPRLAIKSLKLCANNAELFPKVIWPHLHLMWDAYLDTLAQNKEKKFSIGKDIVAANLLEAVQSDQYITEEQFEKSDALLKRYLAGEVPTEEEGVAAVQKIAQLDTGRKIMASISHNEDLMSLVAVVNKAKQNIDSLADTSTTRNQIVYTPFKEISKIAVYQKRIPTGINWLDEITSGGGREGELWLILGGSGQGKTSLTVQYACSQALMGNATLWATYEQSIEGDIAERIIANVTDESLDRIRDRGFDNLDEDIQRKFWASVAGADDKLIVMDMTKLTYNPDFDPKDNGGMYSIWQQYKKLKEEGKHVKTIIVDWVGAMMSVISTTSGKAVDTAFGFQIAAQSEIDIARKMVKEEGIMIIFFHQTDTKSKHARTIYIPDRTCALNMRTMANFMDICITLSNRDPHNVLYMSAVKSRKGNTISRTVQLIGDKCKFINAPFWAPNNDGNFYNQKEDTLSGAPPQEEEVTPFSREVE